jgi:hypothetical protein
LGGDTAGFLPSTSLLKDTAVLAINSFSNSININNLNDSSFLTDTYTVPIKLIAKAKAEGRSKLVIDLQGNGGGIISSVYTIYSILFPGVNGFPIQSQVRAHPQLSWLLTAPRNTTSKNLPWSYVGYRQLDGTPFPSPESFFGPIVTAFGNLTVPALMDPERLKEFSFEIPWSTPPFAPENITILTDGEVSCSPLFFLFFYLYFIFFLKKNPGLLSSPSSCFTQQPLTVF